MKILIDTPFTIKNKKSRFYGRIHSHLVSDNINDLHEFAKMIGLKRSYFHKKKSTNQPHYDVVGKINIALCVELGAEIVTRGDLFDFLKTHYGRRQEQK